MSSAQKDTVHLDSLLNVYEDKGIPVADRRDAYYEYLSQQYLFSNPDTFEILATELINFCNQNEDHFGVITVNKGIAISYAVRGDTKEAKKRFRENVITSRLHGFVTEQANNLINVGNCDIILNRNRSAVDNFSSAMAIYEAVEKSCTETCEPTRSILRRTYFNLIRAFVNLDEPSEAQKYKDKIDNLTQRSSLPIPSFTNSYLLSFVDYKNGNLEEALDILKKQVLDKKDQLDEIYLYPTALNLAGNIKLEQNQLDSAYYYLSKARQTFTEYQDSVDRLSIEYTKDTFDKNIVDNYASFGNFYLLKKDYRRSLVNLNQGLEIAQKGKFLFESSPIYEMLAELHTKIGNHRKSNEYTIRYYQILDSIKHNKDEDLFFSLEEKYEYEKEIIEQKLTLQEESRKLSWTRFFLTGAVVLILGLGLVGYILYSLNSRLQKTKDELLFKNKSIQENNAIIDHQNELLKNQNSDLENFAYVAAHDIKSPLTNIQSYVDLFYNKYRDVIKENDHEIFSFIINDTKRLSNMVSSILDISTLTDNLPPKEKVDLNDLIRIVFAQQEAQIKKLEVDVKLTKTALPALITHYPLMLQLFINLIGNSIKFSKKDATNEIAINYQNLDNNTLEFRVADSGIGLDKNKIPKLFSMFSKHHSAKTHSGSGIGLATCRKIVEFFGGDIRIESELDKGATVIFTIKARQLADQTYEAISYTT